MADEPNPTSQPNEPSQPNDRIFTVAIGIAGLVAMGIVAMIVFRNQQAHRLGPEPGTQLPSFDFPEPPPSVPLITGQFELGNATIPRDQILPGGPPKDGIPALTDPKLVSVDQANHVALTDRVIGVVFDDVARAYPLKILNHHEIVNDTVGGQPVAITYCPLCDSALAFDRRNGDQVREFGVSGLLYGSNVLLYDRGTQESLWSQLMQRSVAGAAVNSQLAMLPLELTTWQAWSTRYPQTEVLSDETGSNRNYRISPYSAYFASDELMFPMPAKSTKLPNKTPVLGITVGDQSRAYPVTAFSESHQAVSDQLGGLSFDVTFDPQAKSLRVTRADDGVRWAYAFWFAWYGFNSDTELYGEASE